MVRGFGYDADVFCCMSSSGAQFCRSRFTTPHEEWTFRSVHKKKLLLAGTEATLLHTAVSKTEAVGLALSVALGSYPACVMVQCNNMLCMNFDWVVG